MTDKPAVKVPEVDGNPNQLLKNWRKSRENKADEWTGKVNCKINDVKGFISVMGQNPLNPQEISQAAAFQPGVCTGAGDPLKKIMRCQFWDSEEKSCLIPLYMKSVILINDYNRLGEDGK